MDIYNKYEIHAIVLENLHNQRKFGRFCDIRLSVGKQFTWIHSAVMCSVSPLINKKCCNALRFPKMKNSKAFSFTSPLTIKLCEKDSVECFQCLLLLIDIIYGQKIEIESDHSAHIYTLCKLLSFSEVLLKSIFKQLKSSSNEADIKKYHITENSCDSENSDDSCKPDTITSINKTTVKVHPILTNQNKQTLRSKYVTGLKAIPGKMQSCIECKYKCYKAFDLLAHLRNTGHGEDVCSLCFIKIESAQELNTHYNLHDHPKPFFCTFCDARFQTRTLLNQHLPRHSNETPYTCSHCKRGFKWKHGLNSHLITHSSEKKHLCDECGFSTTHAKTLRAHKLTHTGELFRCSHPGCTHTSSRKENMKIHLGTHNKEKPFVCEICGHKFTQSKSLKRHALKHSAGRCFNICPHCPFKALRTDNLKSHILRQHTEKPLNLELSDNFTETLINTDCTLIKYEPDINVKNELCVKDENDLSVLADAASSRTKIQNPTLVSVVDDSQVCSISRNFDNLIANPTFLDVKPDLSINIDQIHMFVLCDENGLPQSS